MTYKKVAMALVAAGCLVIVGMQGINEMAMRQLDRKIETAQQTMAEIKSESDALIERMTADGAFGEDSSVAALPQNDTGGAAQNDSGRDAEEPPERESLGVFVATAYCPCAKCCGEWSNPAEPRTASGTIATAGRTVGADWAALPAGTVIEIEGVGERVVEDKPAGWIVEKYDGRILDIYFESHEAALEFGRREVEVWKIAE